MAGIGLMAGRGRRLAALLAAGMVAAAAHATRPDDPAPGPFADAPAAAIGYTRSPYMAVTACAALASAPAKGVTIVSATPVAAADGTPAFCRITAQAAPAIRLEVDLPEHWNGRLYMMGNGGPAGEADDEPPRVEIRALAMRHGFVAASTNAGHARSSDPYAFADDRRKLVDYGTRAVHLTALVAKAVAARYYGRAVDKAYWNSCSTGGREGLIEAQRFPGDFDGIVAGAPALDFTGLLLQHLWIQRVVDRTPLSVAKIHLVGRADYGKCDAADGLADGLIADPEHCGFDVARDVKRCDRPGDDCLTAAESDAFAALYGGPTSGGRAIFPGLAVGAEPAAASGRATGWDVDARGMAKGGIDVAESQLRHAVFHDPAYDWHRFDLDRDRGRLDTLAKLVDATTPDLTRFRARGGKLLMYYGWADTTLNPLMGVRYFKAARSADRGGTPDTLRLFMVPGMFHCSGGYGPDRFDAMTAIVDWVEAGRAPTRIVAAEVRDGAIRRTRPLCPYPQVGRYVGAGDADAAASFRCDAPGDHP